MLVKVLLNLFYRVASVCQVHENKKLSFKNTREKYNSHSFPKTSSTEKRLEYTSLKINTNYHQTNLAH